MLHEQSPERYPGVTLSKWQSYLIHTYYMTTLMTFSWFSPYLGGRSVGNLMPALLPTHLVARGGAGGVAGWALPCFPSLLTHGRGQGAGDNPYTWQIIPISRPTLNVSRNFCPKSSPNSHLHQIVGSFSDSWSSSSSSLLFPCSLSTAPTSNFPMTLILLLSFYFPTRSIPTIFLIWEWRGGIFDIPNHPTKSILQNSQSGAGGGQTLTLLITTNN
jgi:hypothetical protein